MSAPNVKALLEQLTEPVPAVRIHAVVAIFGAIDAPREDSEHDQQQWERVLRETLSSRHADVVDAAARCILQIYASADARARQATVSSALSALITSPPACCKPLFELLARISLLLAAEHHTVQKDRTTSTQSREISSQGVEEELAGLLGDTPPKSFAQAAALAPRQPSPSPSLAARAVSSWELHPFAAALTSRPDATDAATEALSAMLAAVLPPNRAPNGVERGGEGATKTDGAAWALGVLPALRQVYYTPSSHGSSAAAKGLRDALHRALSRAACASPAIAVITLPFIASFLSRALAAPLQRGALSAETAFVASTAADAIDMLETIEASLGHMPDPARALASAVSRAAWLAASAGSPLPGAVTLLARLHRACPGALEGHLPAIATMTAGAPERDAAAFLSLWTLEMRAAGARSAARVPARASCSAVVQAAALLPPSVSRDVALQALRELCAVFDVRQNYGASGTAEEGHVLAETVWHLGGGAAARGCDAAAMLASLATCLESGGVLARGEDPGPSGKRTALTLEIPEEASGPVLGRLAMSQAAISAFLCDTEPRVVNAACRAAAALVRLGSRSGSRGSAVSGAARGAALALLPVVLWRVQILGMQSSHLPPADREQAARCVVALLNCVPSLAVHPSSLGVALQALRPLCEGTGLQDAVAAVVRPAAIAAVARMWDAGRGSHRLAFPVLLGPKPPLEAKNDLLSVRFARALAIRDICRASASRGLDLVAGLQGALSDPHPFVAALGIEAIAALCEKDALDFFKSIRVVLDVFPEVPAHPRLAAAWVWLLRGGALDAQANMEVAESILDLLWRATAHQEATVRAAAHSCLSQYSISLMQDAGCSRSGAELFRILTVETDGRVRAAMLPLIRETALFESRRRRAAAASRGVSSRYAMATAAGVPSLLRHLAVTAPMALAGARGAEGQERAGCLVATAETVDAALSEGAFQGYPMAESSWRALGTVMVYVNGLCRALEEPSALSRPSSPQEATATAVASLRRLLSRLAHSVAAYMDREAADPAAPPALSITLTAATASGASESTRVSLRLSRPPENRRQGDGADSITTASRAVHDLVWDIAVVAGALSAPSPCAEGAVDSRRRVAGTAGAACVALAGVGCTAAIGGARDTALGQIGVQAVLEATELATATGQTTFVAPALASLSHALPAIPSPDAALMQRCFLAFTAAASSSPLPLAARASALLALSALSSATSRAAAASSGAPALQLAQTAIDSIAFLASFADAAAAACGCRCTPLAEALPDGGDPGAGARGLGDPIPAPDAAALLNAALSSVAAAVSATGCFSPASVDALRDLADTVLRSGLPFWDEGEGGGEDASLSLGTVEDSRRERLASGGAAAACAGFVELACACDLLRATEAGVAGPQAGCKGGALIRCCRVLLGQVRRAPGAPQLPRGVVARLLTCAAASASALVHSGTPVDLDVVAALASLSTSALCGGRWVPLAEQGRQKGAGEAREGDGTAGGPEEPSPLAGFLAPEHLPGDGQAVPALMGAEVQAAGATAAALLLAGSPRASSILPWASVGAGTSSTPSKDSAGDLRAPALARPLLQSLGAGPELQIARLLVAGLSGCVRGAPGIPDASRAERDIGAACASAPGVPSAVGALAHVCSCARGAVSAVAGVADDAPGGALGGVRGADERSFVHAALMHLSGLAERGPGSVAGAAASDHACDVLRACLEGLGSAQKVPSSSFGSLVSSVALELRARPALQTLCVEVLQRHCVNPSTGCLHALEHLLSCEGSMSPQCLRALLRAVPTAADSLSPPAAAALYDRALSLAIRGSSVPPPPALSSLASGTTLSRGSVSPAAVDMLMRAVTSGALPRVPPASPGLWHSCLTLGSSSPSAGESPGTLAELLCDGDAYPFGSALGARCGDGAAGTRGYAEGSKEGESSSCWRAIFAALASSSAKRSDLTQGLISAASGAGVEAAHASMALAFLVWMRFAGADTLAAVAGARIRDPDPESAACLPWLGLAAVGLPVASQQSVLGEVAGLLKSAKGAARGACLAVMGSIAACALGEALLSAIEGHATHGGADGISMLPEVLPELVRTPAWAGVGGPLGARLVDALGGWTSEMSDQRGAEVAALARTVLSLRSLVGPSALERALNVLDGVAG